MGVGEYQLRAVDLAELKIAVPRHEETF